MGFFTWVGLRLDLWRMYCRSRDPKQLDISAALNRKAIKNESYSGRYGALSKKGMGNRFRAKTR